MLSMVYMRRFEGIGVEGEQEAAGGARPRRKLNGSKCARLSLSHRRLTFDSRAQNHRQVAVGPCLVAARIRPLTADCRLHLWAG